MNAFDELRAQVRAVRPKVALVLGSGLASTVERIEVVTSVPFGAIPDLPAAGVSGHRGWLTLGRWQGRGVLVFEGRLHHYEGHPWTVVVKPVELAADLGVRVLVCTNAAGGIHPELTPGRLMLLSDHLDMTRPRWYHHFPATRPSPYDAKLRGDLLTASEAVGVPLLEGVYGAVTGPSYETPAEIRAFRHCQVDAVGMSTAREIEAAHNRGLRCAALSLVTNRAAGLGDSAIDHKEVLQVGMAGAAAIGTLLESWLGSHRFF